MQPGKRPRNLRDISHLYLSSSPSPRGDRERPPALVLLASTGAGPLRAFISAGMAAAFESHGASVTLLETGPGLPCAGYYFALEPERYLGPALDPDSVVESEAGRSICLVYARSPSLLSLAGSRPAPQAGAAVILVAFDWPAGGGRTSLSGILDAIPALSPTEGGPEAGWRGMPSFLLTVRESAPCGAESIVREFGRLFPGAPGLAMFPGRSEGAAAEQGPSGIDPCPFPGDLILGLARRVPPASDFLSGVAGEVLQRLGSRKKEGAGDGA